LNDIKEKMHELEVLNREVEAISAGCELELRVYRHPYCLFFDEFCGAHYAGLPSNLDLVRNCLAIRHAWLNAARRDLLKHTPALTLLTGEKLNWRAAK